VIEAFKNNFKTRLRDKSNDSPNQHNETEPEPMEKKNQQELCAGYNLPPKKKIIHHKGEKTKENKTDPISLDHSLIPINTHGSPSQRVPTVIILHQLCSRIDNIHNHIRISHGTCLPLMPNSSKGIALGERTRARSSHAKCVSPVHRSVGRGRTGICILRTDSCPIKIIKRVVGGAE
jgi:hypothetical protein